MSFTSAHFPSFFPPQAPSSPFPPSSSSVPPPAEMVKGPTPAVRRPSVKKKTNSFLRFQADQVLRLSGRDKVRKGLLARARARRGARGAAPRRGAERGWRRARRSGRRASAPRRGRERRRGSCRRHRQRAQAAEESAPLTRSRTRMRTCRARGAAHLVVGARARGARWAGGVARMMKAVDRRRRGRPASCSARAPPAGLRALRPAAANRVAPVRSLAPTPAELVAQAEGYRQPRAPPLQGQHLPREGGLRLERQDAPRAAERLP